MLSLCKLAKLTAPKAPDTDDYISRVNSRLELINLQEEIPDYVLHHYGYDTSRPRVLEPQEIIRLYVCSEHKEASEIDFRKALDVLQFVTDEELQNELFVEIWATAILRDSWTDMDLSSPIDSLQYTLFFRLADLSLTLGKIRLLQFLLDLRIVSGADVHSILPEHDLLINSPLLVEIQENKHFQYLIKTAYEHVYRSVY